jgi:hypothetical protein
MNTPNHACTVCGASVDSGRIFCAKCGAPIRTPSSLLPSNSNSEGDAKLKPWYKLSARELIFLLAMYCLGFVLLRFDLVGHSPHRYPMSNRTAAILALICVVFLPFYQKWYAEHDSEDD